MRPGSSRDPGRFTVQRRRVGRVPPLRSWRGSCPSTKLHPAAKWWTVHPGRATISGSCDHAPTPPAPAPPLPRRGHRQLALENLALRHQLAVYKRTVARPKLRTMDRLLWVGLARVWTGWRQVVVIVSPDTVLRWQRRRFREYWTQLSGRRTGGRPPVNAETRSEASSEGLRSRQEAAVGTRDYSLRRCTGRPGSPPSWWAGPSCSWRTRGTVRYARSRDAAGRPSPTYDWRMTEERAPAHRRSRQRFELRCHPCAAMPPRI